MRKALVLVVAVLALLPACRKKQGPPDVAALIAQLQSPDVQKRGQARLTLIALGEEAAPALAGMLRSGGPEERLAAANILWAMGPRGRAAVPELAQALDDGDATPAAHGRDGDREHRSARRSRPCRRWCGRSASVATARVRQAAAKALGAIGPGARDALPALTRELRRESWPEAEEAVRRIRGLAPGAPSAERGEPLMSLAGRLEDIELAEILHFLALSSRTGRLALTRRDAQGTIVIRLGRVLYAASSSIRETLGSLLVCRGLVSPEALAEALDRQHVAADGRKLGAILVEQGTLGEAQLDEVLHQQTALVVQELCGWRSGYFRFELVPVASSGEIGVDVEDLVVAAGVPTDQILLEAITRIDEQQGGSDVPPCALDVARAGARAGAARRGDGGPAPAGRGCGRPRAC